MLRRAEGTFSQVPTGGEAHSGSFPSAFYVFSEAVADIVQCLQSAWGNRSVPRCVRVCLHAR
jgi:hypothetical protein